MTTAHYMDAFERVLDQWLTLEERFPMALPGLAHETVMHDEGGDAVTAEAVLQTFSACPEPLPEHIKTRCPSFLCSGSYGELAGQMLDTMVRIEAVLRITYADLAKFLAAVGELLAAQEPPAGAKLN